MLNKTSYQVLKATNGLEAIEQVKNDVNDQIKMIIMDIKMPYMDGFQAFTKIRGLGKETPIIAVTAYASSEDKAKILEYGFTDYVSKPIDKKQIFNIIDNI